MCYYSREIYNQYTGKTVRVKCGKCPACLMEKAISNVNLIKHHQQAGQICWFVTLTYRNDSCPYILRSDIDTYHPDAYIGVTMPNIDAYDVPVYRDCDCRRVRSGSDYSMYNRRRLHTDVIGSTLLPCPMPFQDYQFLVNQPDDKIGVLFFDDVVNFLKRLRINLDRHYGFSDKISVFYCGEYGETTLRPHFHLLIFTPTSCYSFFKRAVASSWPYADFFKQKRYCEIAKSAASYVASYVNSNVYLPSFLLNSPDHSPKVRHSVYFGFGLDVFSFKSVAQKISRRTLEYDVLRTSSTGKPETAPVLIPQYVLRRWFPKVKGYSRLDVNEIIDIYTQPLNLLKYVERLEYNTNIRQSVSAPVLARLRSGRSCDLFCDYRYRLNHQQDDFVTNYRKIARARRYAQSLGYSPVDFAILVRDCWHLYNFTLLKYQYTDKLLPLEWFEQYDNISVIYDEYITSVVKRKKVSSINESLFSLFSSMSESDRRKCHRNPNKFNSNVERTERLIAMHKQAFKKSKTNNFLYSQLNTDM